MPSQPREEGPLEEDQIMIHVSSPGNTLRISLSPQTTPSVWTSFPSVVEVPLFALCSELRSQAETVIMQDNARPCHLEHTIPVHATSFSCLKEALCEKVSLQLVFHPYWDAFMYKASRGSPFSRKPRRGPIGRFGRPLHDGPAVYVFGSVGRCPLYEGNR
jgi:hypothetical protein